MAKKTPYKVGTSIYQVLEEFENKGFKNNKLSACIFTIILKLTYWGDVEVDQKNEKNFTRWINGIKYSAEKGDCVTTLSELAEFVNLTNRQMRYKLDEMESKEIIKRGKIGGKGLLIQVLNPEKWVMKNVYKK